MGRLQHISEIKRATYLLSSHRCCAATLKISACSAVFSLQISDMGNELAKMYPLLQHPWLAYQIRMHNILHTLAANTPYIPDSKHAHDPGLVVIEAQLAM